ncbi:hypothetical protein BJ508DRAFT_413558 [Ascobolus immersus RN42]|uniref:G-patch domain-containing protein n=1 Tax=Ascobolus immersus RN42 TaxID=1160509 RepID=A0A3N4IGQ4_ASCIM|nr:hypothetical protein BJ508DRAFT_413558 [Ascobolus immersus RN42]
MGLAGPRNKSKIGHDPRNTHWANNTTRFGHKMLTQQGWNPGDTLGSHTLDATTLTDASHSHIKVFARSDNAGIGALPGADDTTGLDAFQRLLGRLNGKEEQVNAELQRKIEERIGGVKWVKGGVYVSGDIEALRVAEMERRKRVEEEKNGIFRTEESSDTKGKRKRDDADSEKSEKKKKKRKEKDLDGDSIMGEAEQSTTPEADSDASSAASSESEKKSRSKSRSKSKSSSDKKSKSKSKKSKSKSSSPDSEMTDSDESKSSKKDKKEKKKEKKEKKERKAKEKEEKKKRKEAEKAATSGGVLATKTEPAAFVNQTGRHALRHRFIAAKRKAIMDDAALNEIFMIKAQA